MLKACELGGRLLKRSALPALVGVTAVGIMPLPALSQTASLFLEEITVTARKREESLQDTPISISAFSADAIAARQMSTIADVGHFTPNMSFDSASAISGSSNSATVFIRGVGQTDFNLTIDPGVGIYLDGVYVSRSVGALLDTADLEQIQVLRGPQGTLFGKNTIGGAVVLTSRAPGDEPGLSAELTTGRFGRLDGKFNFNLPVTDRAAVRASISRQSRDGYGSRLTDGQELGDRDSWSGRIVGSLEATETLSLTLAIDGTRSREHSPPIKLLEINEFGFFPMIYNNFVAGGQGCAQFQPDGSMTPTALDNPSCQNAQWLTDGPYTNHNTQPDDSNLDLWGVSLTADWDLSWAGVKSITAYRDLDSSFTLEHDGSPLDATSSANEYSQWQFSQEFQLQGATANNRLQWLAGLYYFKEKGADRNFLSNFNPQAISFMSGGKVDNDSYASFAQLTYDLTDALSLTLGGRYTYEKKRFLPEQEVLFIDTAVAGFMAMIGITDVNGDGGPLQAGSLLLPQLEGSVSAKEFTPAVTLDYRLSDEAMAYASYSKGFKSGGFTQRVFPPLTQVPDFAPEFAESYEIGLKTEFFDRRLRLNAAAFHMDYTDLQVLVTEFIAPTVQNAGKARIKGFEANFEARPFDWLHLDGGVGLTDAAYRDISPAAAPVTVASKLPNAPEWTANLGANIYLYTGAIGELSVRADWAYRGDHFKDAVNTPLLHQSGYGLWNLSTTFIDGGDRWSLTAGVTNLGNERYLVSGYSDIDGVGTTYGIFSRPREWFVTARLKY